MRATRWGRAGLLAIVALALLAPPAAADLATVPVGPCVVRVLHADADSSALLAGGCSAPVPFWWAVLYTDTNCEGGFWLAVVGAAFGNRGLHTCNLA